jgi:membrane peptidoglycan carboxypeptidase
LANTGRRVEPVTITRITDHAGKLIYELPAHLNPGPRVMDARTAYLITDILSDNYARRSTFGAGSPLQLGRPAAAKTGTTQDWRDNWTVGYTPDLVVGVWVGNADNEPMRHVSGVTGAAPIWHDLIQELLKTRPVRQFPVPAGLIEVAVCTDNGLLPLAKATLKLAPGQAPALPSSALRQATACPHTITEKFIAGTEPRQYDDWRQAIALDRRNGLRAGPGCPLDFVTLQTFTVYPAEAQAWAKKRNIPQPPDAYSPLCPQQVAPKVGINQQPGQSSAELSTVPFNPHEALIFTSPDQGSVFRIVPDIPIDKQKIRVSVRPANGVSVGRISLLVNGQPLAEGTETLWQMSSGDYTFEAAGIDMAGNPISARKVTVRIVE